MKRKKQKSDLLFKKLNTESLKKVLGTIRGGRDSRGGCTAQGDKGGTGGADACACGCS